MREIEARDDVIEASLDQHLRESVGEQGRVDRYPHPRTRVHHNPIQLLTSGSCIPSIEESEYLDMSHRSPRILLVEDHELMGQALTFALRLMGFEHVELATDLSPEAVLAASEQLAADIVLLEIYLGLTVTSIPMIGP